MLIIARKAQGLPKTFDKTAVCRQQLTTSKQKKDKTVMMAFRK
jgi:hypothetical protein